MNDVFDLYQDLIIDHAKNPKNFGNLDSKSHFAIGNNPLCGDRILVNLLIKNEHIKDISFFGEGCAICKASASLMTEIIKHKSVSDALALFKHFRCMVTKEESEIDLGKLNALKGVRNFPARVKCATLCWHTMKAAIDNTKEISTES